MEIKERKAQIDQLLRSLAASDAQEAKWVRELLELHAEDAKERLVNAEGIDVPRIQGEARLMDRIVKQMSVVTANPQS
jgi:hypothetical protein